MTLSDDVPAGENLGIVVVGAGLVGPVTAIYLARRFGSVTVLEQHDDPRRNDVRRGRSLMVVLSVRGWRVLRELGVADAVSRICLPLYGRCAHLPDGDTEVMAYSRDGRPIWAVERERLVRVLLTAAEAEPGVRIRFRQRVRAVDPETPAVCLQEPSGARWLPCQRVLGCDGARSVVRAGLVAGGARAHVRTLELAYQEINLSMSELDRRFMHYWPAGDALFGAFPTVSSADMFAGSVFFRLEGPAPSYTSVTAGHPLTDQFVATFPTLAEHIPDLPEQLAGKPVATIPLVHCDRWAWSDRVALIGDSCHAMAPFMGHGMNCAFEDARVLDACLAETGDWASALARYERTRMADAGAIADISQDHYRIMSHQPDRKGDDVVRAVTNRLTELFPTRFMPLYERCSFTEENYASARQHDQHLHDVASGLVRRYGTAVLSVPDGRLREYTETAWSREIVG